MALSVAFGLYVNYEAQGLETTFLDTLMAMIPHYCFWVLVSPPIYRALHRTISGPGRLAVGRDARRLERHRAHRLDGDVVPQLRAAARPPPTLERLIDIYFLPPIGPAFWAMNFSILAIALAAFAALRNNRLRLQAQWDSAQTELREARLEAQLAEARLLALQTEINPHFLLNSLNAIASLVHNGERDRAFDAIGRLGELLQVALRAGHNPNVALAEEMKFLHSYFELCKLRFDAQFHYGVSMPEDLGARRLPALIVQPLIENAVQHGMESGRVLNVGVRAYARGDELVIEVEDDGRGIATETAVRRPQGRGLANVAERLRLSFGTAGQLSLEPRAPRGTLARIVIGG